eukprot:5989134-Pleurochrysis_carterae.AAC.1
MGSTSHLNSWRSRGSSAPSFCLSSHSALGDHSCRISKNLARVSHVTFDFQGTEGTWADMVTRPTTTGAAIARVAGALDEDQAN